ncbi:hypothetical protein IGI37_002439 [Enterococcus sp. AZ194]|uniref:GNAT family N-acetyltransferase n=1 Tax=Enterococcus sp. AZ194 TaxID=2774629 RepID=UPI003F29396B
MIRSLLQTEPLPWHLLLDADPEKEIVEGYINHSEILVAVREEKIIGCLAYQIREEEAELMNVAVDSAYQGQGLGKQLVEQALIEIGANKPYSPFPVLVKTGNSTLSALALYKSQGFQEVARVKDYFLTHYSEKIYEEGILLTDQVILNQMI